MRILGWLLVIAYFLSTAPVLAQDFTGSEFLLRDPFLTLVGGYASSSSFALYSQTGAVIDSGLSAGSTFTSRSGTESYAHFTSPVVTASAGDAQVSLSWTASETFFGGTVSSYSVGQAQTAGGPYTYTNVGTSLSAVISGLTNSSAYYFILKVNDALLGQNTYSTEVSSTPVASVVDDGGGSGGGSGGGGPLSGSGIDQELLFTGYAYPEGEIVVLEDGGVAGVTQANQNGEFELTVSNLSVGTYNFSLYGRDSAGRRSSTKSLQVSVAEDLVTTISGIYLSPTIVTDKERVKHGDQLAVFGQTVPGSVVSVFIDGLSREFAQVIADTQGEYTYALDTAPLSKGDYSVRVTATQTFGTSDLSAQIDFEVADENVLNESDPTDPEDGHGYTRADLNEDGRINLVDFAIAGYWYQRPLGTEFAKREAEYLNGDGKIDLIDFAIMAFYWTG